MITTEILQQGKGFLYALLLGLILGAVYDFLRIPGRRFRLLTPLLDLVFGLLLFLGNFLLFLYVGQGSYRIYFLVASAGGFLLWMRLMRRFSLLIFGYFWKAIAFVLSFPVRILYKIIEKMKIFLKKLFSNRKKSVTI
jgi:hypothetical protein